MWKLSAHIEGESKLRISAVFSPSHLFMNCGCTRYDFAYYQLTCLLSLFVMVRTQCIVVSNSYQIFLFHVYKLYYSRFLHLPCSNYGFSLIQTDHWWIYLPRFVSKRHTNTIVRAWNKRTSTLHNCLSYI